MSRIYNDLYRGFCQSASSSGRVPGKAKKLTRKKDRPSHVAIIGAGISGLRCADVLINNGVRVSIFEARDRIGGRVHQVESRGHLMDIGANWIHGSQTNPIADIAEKSGSIMHDPGESQSSIDSHGERIDNDLATEISEIVWSVIAKAFQHSDEHSTTIDKSTSLMDYFREQIPQIEKDPSKQSLILEEARMWGGFIGDSIERQSLKFFFLEECIEGENTFVADTYQKILADIAATALAKAEIRFNEEVIFFDSRMTEGEDPKTTVHTRSGKEEEFDEVIITAPLGWLKKHARDAFPAQSPLPPRLIQAIDNTSYGRLEKVYVSFPTAYWQDHDKSPHAASPASFCSQSSSSNSTSPPVMRAIPNTSSYPFLTHFHAPNYVPHPPKIPWNQSMINLAALPTATDICQPTLLFYLYGDCGTQLLRQLANDTSDQQPSRSYDPDHANFGQLVSFFRPYYSLLPHYSSDDPSCTPASFLATSWQSDPFSGYGSYTNFQVGLENGDRDLQVMRYGGVETEAEAEDEAEVEAVVKVENFNEETVQRPDGEVSSHQNTAIHPESNREQGLDEPISAKLSIGPSRGIWLAGEHTAPFIALGTTTGAYWSGEEAAGRILRLYSGAIPL